MRLELKYQTHRHIAEALFQEINPLFSIDKNAGPSVSYENVTIYFDDKTLNAYREKHEGHNVRSKLRLRLSRPTGTKEFTRCQIEIKERRGVQTKKRSFPIAPPDLLDAVHEMSRYMLKNHSVCCGSFLFPAVGVRYRRTAVGSGLMPGIRITFDTDATSFHDFYNLIQSKPEPFILPLCDCLIEIKATRPIPATISSLIQKYNLQRVTFSKYAKALENMHEFFDGKTTVSSNARLAVRDRPIRHC